MAAEGDENYLSDDVVNAAGTEQKFKKDITTIPGINGIYASGLYQYARADISEDGKTLRLYYDLNQTEDKTFVVDFGLPVQIPFSEFGITNVFGITVSFDEKNTNMTERQGNYGKGKIDMDTQIVTYTLTKTLDAKVAVPIYLTDAQGKKSVRNVYIIPASNVYYEDSLAAFRAARARLRTQSGASTVRRLMSRNLPPRPWSSWAAAASTATTMPTTVPPSSPWAPPTRSP